METSNRVLFIDDDPPVRTAFGRTLKNLGVTCDLAGNADEALALVKKTTYAVIATDYKMPDGDGLHLVSELQPIQPNATYVLVSGQADLEVAKDAINNHNISFVITKPWDSEELNSLLRRAIESFEERSLQKRLQQNIVQASINMRREKNEFEATLGDVEKQVRTLLLSTLKPLRQETLGHCERVTAFARLLAETMGLKNTEITEIEHGAMLHDIGKIGVPDNILDKPGALTPEEWSIVKAHVTIGANLVEGFSFMANARLIIMQHHERWDGKGYPFGLQGTQSCIGARIVAVADSFDAMVAWRPYRKAKTPTDAAQIIIEESGAQFDPDVVDAFQRVSFVRWTAVLQQYREADPAAKILAAAV